VVHIVEMTIVPNVDINSKRGEIIDMLVPSDIPNLTKPGRIVISPPKTMPYTKNNPPERIKSLPKHAQEIWISAFNSAWEQYGQDEEKANRVAWAAVKKVYRKVGNKWIKIKKKASEPEFIEDILTEEDFNNLSHSQKLEIFYTLYDLINRE